jgi:hypothetical protein
MLFCLGKTARGLFVFGFYERYKYTLCVITIAPERAVRKMSVRPRHAGMVKELFETREKIETIYKVTVGKNFNKKTLEVFPQTIKRLRDINVYLLEPDELAESIREEFRRSDERVKDETARVIYEFNITEDGEKFKIDITVIIGNHTFMSEGYYMPIPDEDLKTQLKYALKIMELDKMIDDLFELLNLYRINEELEEEDD